MCFLLEQTKANALQVLISSKASDKQTVLLDF